MLLLINRKKTIDIITMKELFKNLIYGIWFFLIVAWVIWVIKFIGEVWICLGLLLWFWSGDMMPRIERFFRSL